MPEVVGRSCFRAEKWRHCSFISWTLQTRQWKVN